MDQSCLFFSGLVLELFCQCFNFLLLLSNHLIHFINLHISLELLLLKHEVILLDLVQNFLSLVLPLKVNLLELINFFNLVLLQILIFLDLFLKQLEIGAGLSKYFVVFAAVQLILDLHSLNFFVKLVTFDLIISYGFVGDSEFLLTVLKILLALVNLLLRIHKSLLVAAAVVLQGIHGSFVLVHLLLQHAFPTIQFLNRLNLFLLSLQGVLRKHGILVQILKDLVVVLDLSFLVIVLKQLQDVCPIIISLLSDLKEIDHELRLTL